jgi:hypothetical protein
VSINITSGSGDAFQLSRGDRVVVRNSNGIPYVVCFNNSDDRIDVWKGDGAVPTSFSDEDPGGGPSDANYWAPSDVIHIAYIDNDTAMNNGGLRYVQFRADGTNDDFVNDALAQGWPGVPLADVTQAGTAIAIDSNGDVHIAFVGDETNMGSDYATVYYTNDVAVSGTFKTPVEVEGQGVEKDCYRLSIAIDKDNKPQIAYGNFSDTDLAAAHGDANNATSFTLQDIDSAGQGYPSIAVDSSGNSRVAAEPTDLGTLNLYTLAYGGDWNTGWSQSNSTLSPAIPPVTVACDGDDAYCFFEASGGDADKIWLASYKSSSWTDEGEQEAATASIPKAKWAYNVDYDSTGTDRGGGGSRVEIDYVWLDGTLDVLWNSYSLAAPSGFAHSHGTII